MTEEEFSILIENITDTLDGGLVLYQERGVPKDICYAALVCLLCHYGEDCGFDEDDIISSIKAALNEGEN
jgi:hypothetical protein